jgi:hypothetical protein
MEENLERLQIIWRKILHISGWLWDDELPLYNAE